MDKVMPELNKICGARNRLGQFIAGFPAGFKHSDKTKQKISESLKGKTLGRKRPGHSAWMKNNFISPMLGRKHTEETKMKMSISHIGIKQSLEWRKKRGRSISGVNHPNWKGGPKVPREIKRYIRKSFDYKEWRKLVFGRDGYACRRCGIHGGYLEAHHIKSFSEYPCSRFDVSNGETLCRKCHLSIR